jgi:hypothetical protein
VIVAQEKHGDTPEKQPDLSWVLSLLQEEKDAECDVFTKENYKTFRSWPGV